MDTDEANYLESLDGLYHTYTFPVFRKTKTELDENLLLSLNENNEYDAYLVIYNLSSEEKDSLLNDYSIDIREKISFKPLKNFDPNTVLSKTLYVDVDLISGAVSCWVLGQGLSQGTGWDIVTFEATDCPWSESGGSQPSDPDYGSQEAPSTSNTPDSYNGDDIIYINGSTTSSGSSTSTGSGSGDSPASATFILTESQKYLKTFYYDLTSSQFSWINNNPEDKDVISAFLLINFNPIDDGIEYHSEIEEAQNFARLGIKALMGGGVRSFSEFIAIELENQLQVESFKLIDIDCDQIENWQNLTQFSPPQSVIDKLVDVEENLAGQVNVQTIQNAEGAVVNLDYFPIIIDRLPNNPFTRRQFTADEFLEYIRMNINNFVNTSITNFIPSAVTGFNGQSVWESNNPLGAIISHDIPAGHDGSVICSEYNPNSHWIFTTLTMPWSIPQGLDGPHPVSGNRQIGYVLNTDGSYTFFSRGIDRMESNFDIVIADYMNGGNPFNGADALWNSFQQGVQDFTNSHNGVGNMSPTSINRPNWDKVKNVLLGKRPISDLGCY